MTQPTYISGLLFSRAYSLVRARTVHVLEDYQLNLSYWAVLGATLNSTEGIRLATVAKGMGVKAPLVTVLADDLIKLGLIDRVPHHTDKRAKLLIATAKGRKLGQAVEASLVQTIGQLMKGVSPSDTKKFQATLETIIDNANQYRPTL
jgi:DNA-binding MarR family transcriptional regulator